MMIYSSWKRRLIFGSIISMLVFMLAGPALASGGDESTTITVGRYQVSLVFAEPAKKGENALHVQILDEQGMPVTGAEVEINAIPVEETKEHQDDMEDDEANTGSAEGMDPTDAPTEEASNTMQGMGTSDPEPNAEKNPETDLPVEAVTAKLGTSDESGEYAGNITFPNAGHWMVTVQFTINGEMLTGDFSVEVTGGSSARNILIGFGGIIIVIIILAAVIKRKPASA